MTQFVFGADDGTHGDELWVSDGTAAGTSLLLDLWPGGGSGAPENFFATQDGRALFRASDGIHGVQPWITDGTAAGTHLLLEIPGDDAFPTNWASIGDGRYLFLARDADHGAEPWITDLTPAGTHLLADIDPNRGGFDGSFAHGFTPAGQGRVVFAATDNVHGWEPWVTDGTIAGTHLLLDINSDTVGGNPNNFTALNNGQVLFTVDDGIHGTELWTTDGTTAGTHLLLDLNPGSADSNPGTFMDLGNGRLLFTAHHGTFGSVGNELWVTDGTAAGTQLVADIGPEPGLSNLAVYLNLSLGDGRALFSANDGIHGDEPWVSDGTAAGTHMIADVWPGSISSLNTITYGAVRLADGRVIFAADDPVHGSEPWITDLTAAGTHLLKDVRPGFDSAMPGGFSAPWGSRAIFNADDGVHGRELWVSDGTEAGTQLIDINPGVASSYPVGFIPVSPSPQPPPPVDWNALAAEALANFAATGHWFTSSSPQPPSVTDWNVLAAQVTANFAATGHWFA